MNDVRVVDAVVAILRKEGITQAFGVPGAAINPLYDAMRRDGQIHHVLARHVEGAAHMADGYSRVRAGNIGVCIGTSGPAGTDMITGLYAASADSVPILCITGQAPTSRLHKEDFQAVDIASIAAPLSKLATTVLEPAQVPGVLQQAFFLMRSGRPGPVLVDLPLDVQTATIPFDIELYAPLPPYRPEATALQAAKVLDMLDAAERPVIIAGGGIINADASDLLVRFAELTGIPVIPTLMGWGAIPDDHPLMAGMVGLQTSHRYGNANFLDADVVLGIGNRWANRHTGGLETYRRGRRFIHIDIDGTQIGRVFAPDLGICADARSALAALIAEARRRAPDRPASGAASRPDRSGWQAIVAQRKRTMHRRSHFDNVPMKPQRVYHDMNLAFDRAVRYVTTIGLSQIAAAQFLRVYQPRHWINAGQAGPLGWTGPAALGVKVADPESTVVAISGDYDFQFMIEELAVGAQFAIGYIHIVINNAYLGLIRQAQRAFDMDYQVSLAFANINAPEMGGYGVDHVKVAEGLGCKGLRIFDPAMLPDALRQAQQMVDEYHVPVVVEIVVERVTNIAMGAEIDAINEFEELSDHDDSAATRLPAAR